MPPFQLDDALRNRRRRHQFYDVSVFVTSSPLFRVVTEDLSAGSALLQPRGDWGPRGRRAARGTEYREGRGTTSGYERRTTGVIERHGEISRSAHRPVGGGSPTGKVGTLTGLLVRDIYEAGPPRLLTRK